MFFFQAVFAKIVILNIAMSEKSNPQVKIGHYIIGETLGTGTFGKVKGGYEYDERMSYVQSSWWAVGACAIYSYQKICFVLSLAVLVFVRILSVLLEELLVLSKDR